MGVGFRSKTVRYRHQVLAAEAVFPHSGTNQRPIAASTLLELLGKHKCNTIALGNGQASRETESFLRASVLPKNDQFRFTIVDEAGASM